MNEITIVNFSVDYFYANWWLVNKYGHIVDFGDIKGDRVEFKPNTRMDHYVLKMKNGDIPFIVYRAVNDDNKVPEISFELCRLRYDFSDFSLKDHLRDTLLQNITHPVFSYFKKVMEYNKFNRNKIYPLGYDELKKDYDNFKEIFDGSILENRLRLMLDNIISMGVLKYIDSTANVIRGLSREEPLEAIRYYLVNHVNRADVVDYIGDLSDYLDDRINEGSYNFTKVWEKLISGNLQPDKLHSTLQDMVWALDELLRYGDLAGWREKIETFRAEIDKLKDRIYNDVLKYYVDEVRRRVEEDNIVRGNIYNV